MSLQRTYRRRSASKSRLMLTRSRTPSPVSCGDRQILPGRRPRTLLVAAALAINASTSSSRSGRQTFQSENISVKITAAASKIARQTASGRFKLNGQLVTKREELDRTTIVVSHHGRLCGVRALLSILSPIKL